MKYIVVKANNKPALPLTLKEACRLLKPQAIFKVGFNEFEHISITEINIADYANDITCIVQVGNKKLLLQPGLATQQQVPVPALLHVLNDLGMDIHFVIFAIHTYEELKGFCSLDDLKKFSAHTARLKITWLPRHAFDSNGEWLKMMNHLAEIARNIM